MEETSTNTNMVAAAEEMTATIDEIAQSTQVVGGITTDFYEVNQASSEIAGGSNQVRTSAENLSQLSEQLNQLVGRFKV